MTVLHLEKVNALPGTPAASTMYLVKSADAGLIELAVSSQDGSEIRHILNKTEINTMIGNAISGFNNIQLVADITARDAYTSSNNSLVLVANATGDPTVGVGGALYFYKSSDSSFTKVSEMESLDVVLQWGNIVGIPTSSVANIDDAVSKRHTHTNSSQLAKIGEDGNGVLTYNGSIVEASLVSSQW
jgi:hypothetical protein